MEKKARNRGTTDGLCSSRNYRQKRRRRRKSLTFINKYRSASVGPQIFRPAARRMLLGILQCYTYIATTRSSFRRCPSSAFHHIAGTTSHRCDYNGPSPWRRPAGSTPSRRTPSRAVETSDSRPL